MRKNILLGGVKIVRKRRGKKPVSDYRVRFNGEIRSASGVWTQEQCREYVNNFWQFIKGQNAVYHDWTTVTVVTTRDEGEAE